MKNSDESPVKRLKSKQEKKEDVSIKEDDILLEQNVLGDENVLEEEEEKETKKKSSTVSPSILTIFKTYYQNNSFSFCGLAFRGEYEVIASSNNRNYLITCLENIQDYRHELKKLFLLRIYYVPCVGHSLNLVEEYSVNKCIDFVNFFARLYAFFSVSMHRWSILLKHMRTTLKVMSCHYCISKLSRIIYNSFINYMKLRIMKVKSPKLVTKQLEFDLITANDMLHSLVDFISDLRNDFIAIENDCKNLVSVLFRPIHSDTQK
ncbi:hypothetical protein ALC53_05785 [Atta colombica]|uniref:DUF4371 domain-containing protein n=1 Tax=Atta colombica TaxID=520822 RepID=A0A195BGI5_9HYME|nr:hypothetical protein ALC53_05785 [Atta colombica]